MDGSRILQDANHTVLTTISCRRCRGCASDRPEYAQREYAPCRLSVRDKEGGIKWAAFAKSELDEKHPLVNTIKSFKDHKTVST